MIRPALVLLAVSLSIQAAAIEYTYSSPDGDIRALAFGDDDILWVSDSENDLIYGVSLQDR